jgi:hypothetical protein
VNFDVDAERFLEVYEQDCPDYYDDDEPKIGELFGRTEKTLQVFAVPESIRLDLT